MYYPWYPYTGYALVGICTLVGIRTLFGIHTLVGICTLVGIHTLVDWLYWFVCHH